MLESQAISTPKVLPQKKQQIGNTQKKTVRYFP